MDGRTRFAATVDGARARVRHWQPFALDLPLALLVYGLQAAELYRPLPSGSAARPGDTVGLLLVAAASLPLAVRRVWSRAVLAFVMAVSLVICLSGYRQTTFALSLVPMLYTVSSRYRTRDCLPLLAGLVPLFVIAYLSDRDPIPFTDIVQAVLSVALVWWLGASMRARSERADLLQRLHDETAANAVSTERLRIARELHDVVAHSMSVVAVQSGVARHLIDEQPVRAAQALDAIVASSRSALYELRRLLEVLRQDGRRGDLDPSPTLSDIRPLVDAVAAAGPTIELTLPDPVPEVSPALGLTAYRIVQEALTNTVRHAGPGAAARVSVAVEDRAGSDPASCLVLTVEDRAGRRQPPVLDSAGVGLIGMGERVAVFAGSLQTGPTGDGFTVRAVLPLSERETQVTGMPTAPEARTR